MRIIPKENDTDYLFEMTVYILMQRQMLSYVIILPYKSQLSFISLNQQTVPAMFN